MKYIAHRGNTSGPQPSNENRPDYLLAAIKQGFFVEVDIWVVMGKWWLGHDGPQYEVSQEFVDDISFHTFFHCKNKAAFEWFYTFTTHYHYFWHQEDDFILTSKGWAWCYPGKNVRNGIIVMPERIQDVYRMDKPEDLYGVCSDYISILRKRWEEQ